jgi:restriction modification system, specificity subunit
MNKQQEPRLRFRDFMGAWEDRMLGKVADVRDGTHDSPIYQNQGIPLVTSKNLTENGLDFSNVSLISQEDYEEINKRSKVESGDILLGLIGTIGKPVLVKSGGYAIKNVGLIKELLEVKNEFLLPLLQSNIFETYVSRKNTGNTQKFLALDGLRSFEFLAPSLPEQTHLGNFFRRLDSQIAESRAVLEKSRQLKKAMLAKMFPANGEKIPKIRFKGFEGEWECRKLGEVSIIKTGISNREDSDLFGEYTFFDRSQDVRKSNTYLYDCEAIIMAGEGSEFFPKHFVGKFDLHQRSYAIMNFLECDGLFVFYYLHLMNDYFCNQAVGSTVKSLRLPMFTEMPILLPTKFEQIQIGNFFRQLDETIALQSAEVEKLNQLKKGLLAAMLV